MPAQRSDTKETGLTVARRADTCRRICSTVLPRSMTPNPRQVKTLATQTCQPPVSAQPIRRPGSAGVRRLAKDARNHHTDVLAGWQCEHPMMVQASSPQRCLPVLLHDPAAVALLLRIQMKPDDLMELILILADAAADVLRARRTIYDHYPPRQRQHGR